MRVIIAGAGEVGRGVAAALRGEKRGVAMLDPDPMQSATRSLWIAS